MSRRTVLTLQGVQYAALAYVQRLQQVDAQISMAERGAAWHAKRGYAERLIRTIKEERVLKNHAIERIGTLLTLPALFSGQRSFP